MSRLTIRARLTLVHGGLFFLAGVVLLAATYALVSQRLGEGLTVSDQTAPPGAEIPGERMVNHEAGLRPDDALTALLTQGAIALLVVGAAATALGWLIAGRMLQPLDRVTDTARRIAESPGDLGQRIGMVGPSDELKRLGDTFDLMLERLDQSFDAQRRFIANASHELRTPLTLNRTLLEVAVGRRDVGVETRVLGETLLEINGRHERLIDGLLLLARSERTLASVSYVDLADIVAHVGSSVEVSCAEAPVLGDAVLLERLVQNLVENGVRHNVDGGWVRVSTSVAEGFSVLEVSNSGEVVAGYDVESLFEPFRRLDRAASGGVGLGLSIVRAVAIAHGGSVVARARDTGGLTVTVRLPAHTP
ncbi:two-component sensor histidine kinase [Actinophytocola xinjiangensis]|uniref:histidine kinase n=1 Tax=Actinophytocola xinjiangensis TaxID=485602 RepID=A0A7Z0WK83_9PSEU|nr:ATP-binding protein [Actinophytocola xinjiangensis]OLF09326.1 two-component sensor histidine kinase [Actinophytocola xinjiangensis]